MTKLYQNSFASLSHHRFNRQTNSIKIQPPETNHTTLAACRCKSTQPQFKNGHTPASHRCRLQRVPKNYSSSIEGVANPRFLHSPPRLQRERKEQRRVVTSDDRGVHPQPPATRLDTIVRPGNSLCRNVKRVERVTKDSGVNESLKRETRGWHT